MHVSKAIDYTEIIKSRCEGEKKKEEEKGFESELQNHSAWKEPLRSPEWSGTAQTEVKASSRNLWLKLCWLFATRVYYFSVS